MKDRMRLTSKLLATAIGAVLVFPAAPAAAAPVTLVASLTGPAEVPGPGDADAFGAAEFRVDVRKAKVCFTLVVLDLTLPTAAAHIHEGAEGVAGDIVVTLEAPVEIAGSGIGISSGCVGDQSKALLRNIKNNPDQFYCNVHTSDFPAGAVRGQLSVA
jgi:hypothetical protein